MISLEISEKGKSVSELSVPLTDSADESVEREVTMDVGY